MTPALQSGTTPIKTGDNLQDKFITNIQLGKFLSLVLVPPKRFDIYRDISRYQFKISNQYTRSKGTNKRLLQRAKKKYHYSRFSKFLKSRKVISGIDIGKKVPLKFQFLEKMVKRTHYRIEDIDNKTYSKIRTRWQAKEGDDKLDVTMVVSPTAKYAGENI